jgi:hypothetical protein
MSEDIEKMRQEALNESRARCVPYIGPEDAILGASIMKEDRTRKVLIAEGTETGIKTSLGEEISYQELYDNWLVELPGGNGFLIAGLPVQSEPEPELIKPTQGLI